MKRALDDLNFFPTCIKQEGEKAFILHEHYISTTGLDFAFRNNLRPVVIGKAIGRWSASRYTWDYLLQEAVKIAAPAVAMLTGMRSEQKNQPAHTLPVLFRNLKLDQIICDRAGFSYDKEFASAQTLIKAVGDCRKRRDPGEASRLIAKMMTLYAYGLALQLHDAQQPFGLNGAVDRNPSPTIEDLDKAIAEDGIGDPRWIGDMEFFGWDGNPGSLGAINPERNIHTEEAGVIANCKQIPLGIHIIGYDGCNCGKCPPPHCVTLFSTFDDPAQCKFREMNWHLPPEQFRQCPHGADRPLLEEALFRTKNQAHANGAHWIGEQKATSYFREEGMPMDLRFMGGIILPQDFHSRSDLIAEHTQAYPPNHPAADQIWTAELTDVASRMISAYGLTGASIIEQLQIGYMVIPAVISNDINSPEDEKAAVDKMQNITGPFVLAPVFSMESVKQVANPGEQKEAFIDLFRHTHLPHCDRETVANEVDLAIQKLTVLYERSHTNNFMDRIGKLCWAVDWCDEALKDKNKKGRDTFTQMLDLFAERSTSNWKQALQNVREKGSIA